MTPPQAIGDRPGSGSVTTNDVIVTLPTFVTTNLKVTVSPALVAAVAFELFTIVTPGVFVSGVERESVSVTGPAVAVWPFTVAVLLITPASMSACVTMYVAVHVTVASGASEFTPWQLIGDRPGSGSVMANDVIVTLPVFVTRKLNVTMSPALVAAFAFELLTSVTAGTFESGVVSVLSAATAPAGVWPFTVAVFRITPASTSACFTV